MNKIFLIIVICLSLCGCSNLYEKGIRTNLEHWKYWQENYYIQRINTYEMVAPNYIQGLPHVEVLVRMDNKYNPYNFELFTFFIRKDYPLSECIPQNKRWFEWIKKVKQELDKETII